MPTIVLWLYRAGGGPVDHASPPGWGYKCVTVNESSSQALPEPFCVSRLTRESFVGGPIPPYHCGGGRPVDQDLSPGWG